MSSGQERDDSLEGLETPSTSCIGHDGKKSADLALLEARIEDERDARKEERFYWIFALTIAIDMIAFQWMTTGIASLIVFLELMVLFLLANYLGVDPAVDLLKMAMKWLMDKLPGMKHD